MQASAERSSGLMLSPELCGFRFVRSVRSPGCHAAFLLPSPLPRRHARCSRPLCPVDTPAVAMIIVPLMCSPACHCPFPCHAFSVAVPFAPATHLLFPVALPGDTPRCYAPVPAPQERSICADMFGGVLSSQLCSALSAVVLPSRLCSVLSAVFFPPIASLRCVRPCLCRLGFLPYPFLLVYRRTELLTGKHEK